jgi:two-component system chemotaxis sensor kinase CheA
VIQNQDFINEFVDEANIHMEVVESTLLKNEEIGNDQESINEIFRAVHSIKGTASFFGLKKIVSLSHMMENIFGEIRNNSFELTNEIADIMILANDKLKELISDVINSEDYDISNILDDLTKIMEGNLGEKKTVNEVIVLKTVQEIK